MTMVLEDIIALLPALILAVAALITMLMAAFAYSHGTVVWTTVIAQGLALAGVAFSTPVLPRYSTALFLIDEYSTFYMVLILVGTTGITALSYGYFREARSLRNEYYALLLLASLGAVVLVMATHGASFFLGLELLSVSLYVLISYTRWEPRPLEAGIKYLILSATASAFLLLGLAFIYYLVGDLRFSAMRQALAGEGTFRSLFLVGLGLMLTGIGFKLAIVPFHMWAPDVYQGSPAPITAFVATISKVAVAGLLLRMLLELSLLSDHAVTDALSLLAIASMFAGNLLALLQDNVKRLLAYSSIAHLGYLLVALIAGGELGAEAVGFYLSAYMITMLGTFGVITLLSRPHIEVERLEDLSGLLWRHPVIGAIWIIGVLSLAGIPLTAGFVVKFYVVVAALSSDHLLLVILFVLNSVIGLFYYLKLVQIPFAADTERAERERRVMVPRWNWSDKAVLASVAVVIVWLGVYPIPFMELLQQIMTEIWRAT